MREEQEEKVSSRRREKDLYAVERNLFAHEQYWESVTLRSREYLFILCVSHLLVLYRLCSSYYYQTIDVTYIVPALVTSGMLAWYVHAGRCHHLNGLEKYRNTTARALARLSVRFNKKQLSRTALWSTEVRQALIENAKIKAMVHTHITR